MRTFFLGLWSMLRWPRFFIKAWRESYRKMKAEAEARRHA